MIDAEIIEDDGRAAPHAPQTALAIRETMLAGRRLCHQSVKGSE